MTNQSVGRLFVLDASGGRVFSMNPDGSDSKTLVTIQQERVTRAGRTHRGGPDQTTSR